MRYFEATSGRPGLHSENKLRVVGADDHPIVALTFESFYQREFPAMVALARGICGDVATAEDMAQEAFAKAHENWPQIATYDRPGAWLRRVTINLAISRRRRAKRELTLLRRKALERRTPHPEPAEDEALWNAVQQLPPRQRAVVALFYQEDRSTREIADILECSISTATSHLNQARTRLARELGEPAATIDMTEPTSITSTKGADQ